MKDKRKKADWLTIIPILFWLSCMAFSLAKLYQSGNEIHIIDYIEILYLILDYPHKHYTFKHFEV